MTGKPQQPSLKNNDNKTMTTILEEFQLASTKYGKGAIYPKMSSESS